jgi:hypothetical protein
MEWRERIHQVPSAVSIRAGDAEGDHERLKPPLRGSRATGEVAYNP